MTTAREPRLLDVYAARRRLAPFLRPTPLLHSDWLSSIADAEVHLKVESVQPSRAFKIRGALNALLTVAEHKPTDRPTIVTASAGNHGRAVALAAAQLGFRAIVFTPTTAPETKKAAIRRHGAELRDDSPDYDAAEREARTYADSKGALYVSSYNDADVIAGAGTAGIEILEVLPSLDVIVVPVGGGGLASGLAIAVKAAAPRVALVGVEAEASTALSTSIARGVITEIDPRPSLADGLTGNLEPGSITFDIVRRHIDDFVSVSEGEIAGAIRGLAGEDHLVAEGAGAAATAAVIAKGAVKPGQRAVVMLTGSNIDLATFISAAATAESPRDSEDSAPGAPADRR